MSVTTPCSSSMLSRQRSYSPVLSNLLYSLLHPVPPCLPHFSASTQCSQPQTTHTQSSSHPILKAHHQQNHICMVEKARGFAIGVCMAEDGGKSRNAERIEDCMVRRVRDGDIMRQQQNAGRGMVGVRGTKEGELVGRAWHGEGMLCPVPNPRPRHPKRPPTRHANPPRKTNKSSSNTTNRFPQQTPVPSTNESRTQQPKS